MHGEISGDFPGVRAGSFHPAALKGDFGKFGDVEEIRGAQVIIPFRIRGVDARRLNRRDDGGFFRMIAIDLNRSAEFREFAFRGSEKLPNFEGDGRVSRVEFETLIRMN